jgi:hypothetical protein
MPSDFARPPARKRWPEGITSEERARWFRYTTPEQLIADVTAACEDPVTLAMVAQMVVDTLKGPARTAQAA